MTTHARAYSVAREKMNDGIVQIFQRKERPAVPTLSMCGAPSFSMKELKRANNNASRVLCPGGSDSSKLTPRAQYNNYTPKERAEIGKYAAENRPSKAARCFSGWLGHKVVASVVVFAKI